MSMTSRAFSMQSNRILLSLCPKKKERLGCGRGNLLNRDLSSEVSLVTSVRFGGEDQGEGQLRLHNDGSVTLAFPVRPLPPNDLLIV